MSCLPAGSAGGRSATRATPGRWAATPPPSSARAPDAKPLPARYVLSPAGPAERVFEADGHVALDHRPPWGRHWPTAISPRVSRPRKIVRSEQQKVVSGLSGFLVTGHISSSPSSRDLAPPPGAVTHPPTPLKHSMGSAYHTPKQEPLNQLRRPSAPQPAQNSIISLRSGRSKMSTGCLQR